MLNSNGYCDILALSLILMEMPLMFFYIGFSTRYIYYNHVKKASQILTFLSIF